ncbi:stAR-related lipid transfer protein 5 isoform X1 [Cyprinodon tularosa]|uniref:StAR related lipid transfer domain containing 5 n=1 Tax=Cyprinodon variegatus TaxID=28743 RepID=A0A3Q2GLW4_CYPVA|nr:PREDICTED: stAR-related lipid transfer protein 5 [Cyprinodon variegatus]XP_038163566.1 stAR-related lipid transfer protein 5 isoform X1 [Cyprinodon tularosa]XP_038163568.1 stAR-related lipid transfer protein 5 isoform X1 [Cyprinodon tularosa]
MVDYEAKAKAVADCLLSYRRDESGWKVCRKSNDVVVSWRPSSEFPGNVYKGEGVVSGRPEKVWECLKPVPNGLRVKWDSNVKRFELLEQIMEDVSVCRTVTPSAAMGIIAPRDFVDVILVKQYEDGSISSNATNVTHPSCPPQPGYVRGANHACGCICIPVSGDPGRTQVMTFFQTDLGGLLPRSVVDSFFPSSMAEFYNNLAKAVRSLRDL